MANRLKRVLQDVISKSQSAFIENKLIFDNSLIAFELAHFMKRKTRGQDFWAALKLDMIKAFDHIKWAFIRRTIEYGLCWILDQQSDDVHLLYLLYYTSGRWRDGLILPTRGLHQGCPLSLYLFIIGFEGLSYLLQHKERMQLLRGCLCLTFSSLMIASFFSKPILMNVSI